MKRFVSKKVVAVGVAAGLAIGISGAAFAFWTQGGSGTGSATTGTTTAITVHQTSASSGLYPGGSVALSGNFDNPNASPVTISSVTVTIDSFSLQADNSKPACTQADFSISGSAAGSAVPVGNGVGSWSGLSLNMSNSGTNQDNCKSITVPLTYTANA